MSERDKQIEKERKGVVELLLKKNGLTRKPCPFNSNHIFVDTRSRSALPLGLSKNSVRLQGKNVLVGGYNGDARFQRDADCLHYLYSLTGKRLYISTLDI